MVFAADVDGHAVCAIERGGRQDRSGVSPPRDASTRRRLTTRASCCSVRATDRSIACVPSDGALAWRFIPLERRLICAYGQPESAWPICGSILVRDGLAYFAAGRNSFTDGGIFLYALDPRTGKVVHQQRMYGPYGENGFPIENREVVSGMSIEGFKGDIFLADDETALSPASGIQRPTLSPVKLQDVKQPHLIPSHGFLEAIPQHRSFWTIDTMLHYDIPTGRGRRAWRHPGDGRRALLRGAGLSRPGAPSGSIPGPAATRSMRGPTAAR